MTKAALTLRPAPEGRTLLFTGRLDAAGAAALWPAMTRALVEKPKAIDLSGVKLLDSAGAILVLRAGDDVPVLGAAPDVLAVLERNRTALKAAPLPVEPPRDFAPITAVGGAVFGGIQVALSGIAFAGEALVAALRVMFRPRMFRGAEFLRHLDEIGLRAFPLTLLLGFLIGMILAYQSSIPLKRFGAEIFVPNLVGISLLRELGPLLAGVVLAGRTGSAFAAELGTMTVNEEVNALRIMGIDPMVMLVLPRILAGILVMPALTLVMNLAGLTGMTAVMQSLGFPWSAVSNQLQYWLSLGDLMGGLFKSACFGLVIAAIGCRAGLSAGFGPRAVGDAATAAVVGGIVAIVAMDGVFAILFFRLGI
ncbi:MAG: ABC transporter permease [Alphaproteobacteria bacterium]|nr:ABC transporter permease [Alphaproteobacteria bacterium]